MKTERPKPYASCIKCGKPFPTPEFFIEGGVCIICEHLESAVEKQKN